MSICAAADRASRLVRQLLTFSRKQIVDIRACQVRECVAAMTEMLPRLIGPQVKITINTPSELALVQADAGMLDTMLLNLAVNARDAMPDGGALTISAANTVVDEKTVSTNPEAHPGNFVRISVRDTGTGIPPEVLPRIFEPFYTTKPVGKGTGLGLATVYGIVKQHQGWIDVQSEPGKGAEFRIYLPALASEKKETPPPPPSSVGPIAKGNEMILVVEDEPDLRDLVTQLLQGHGYQVVSAATGTQALQVWSQWKNSIQLVLTDMIMPDGLTGKKLAEKILAESPQMPIIYTSGYHPDMNGTGIGAVDQENFLGKPYRPADLFQIVERCLESSSHGPHRVAA
jgi:CheY-like chemotaxis protein